MTSQEMREKAELIRLEGASLRRQAENISEEIRLLISERDRLHRLADVCYKEASKLTENAIMIDRKQW